MTISGKPMGSEEFFSQMVEVLSKGDKYICRIRVLSVFIGKNVKSLKRSKYKGFLRFFVIWNVDDAFKIWRK